MKYCIAILCLAALCTANITTYRMDNTIIPLCYSFSRDSSTSTCTMYQIADCTSLGYDGETIQNVDPSKCTSDSKFHSYAEAHFKALVAQQSGK